ncbi:hypothetical protein KIW84_043728 [Lathyrus oleraceus]|uniref:RRM domain-containing protein n=1 Tax=Pisum sativum TaxID=3888 RepID=A0A9D4XI91_PEA|nr:hypothetical protein KIW84_043728 [Pisum sativum]
MARVYIGNLNPRITERELEDEFRFYRVLRSVWVARRPPRYSFIEFDDRRDALDAIHALDGQFVFMLSKFVVTAVRMLSVISISPFTFCASSRFGIIIVYECPIGKNGWRVELSHNSKSGGGGRGGGCDGRGGGRPKML